ncbi:MAG: glycosyltransferase family 4 protein, partial [Cyanobacteria bacterium J06656_5]
VTILAPLELRIRRWVRIKGQLHRLYGKKALWTRSKQLLTGYARLIDNAVEHEKPDIIFSPGTEPLAYLSNQVPKVFWTDAPLGAMIGYYPWYKNIASASLNEAMESENRATQISSACIYSSQWACQQSHQHHRTEAGKLHVLPFGGNYRFCEMTKVSPPLRINPESSPMNLLFLGVDWDRKGGDHALQIVRALTKEGLDSRLTVVGCDPPSSLVQANKTLLRPLPKLNLNEEADLNRLYQLMVECQFLLLPSKQEAYGQVYCEALAAGVIPIGRDTGGVSEIIKDGQNGLLIRESETPIQTARRIIALKDHYQDVSQAAVQDWRNRLDWSVQADKLKVLFRSLL